ncbi:RNA 2',3'-cyclic phosphodiesterase [Amycolatopsis palatopharyngis]|uniref:RNA 2',3'-cyclic phosphodiesterase n=1 Tax=Amycolatopsis palatopharyngis TaxID=187982 RepID=UPI001FE2FE21|nr:RNA 2',3'-cyclic phosphodiesterase [Amycolatopsis palatopharyngis]
MSGVRLFSALVPPADAVRSLREALDGVPGHAEPGAAGLRWIPPHQWHITLGFYGADDPQVRADHLGTTLAGLTAREVRLTGSGTFPGVLWVGVDGNLGELATATKAATEAESGDRPFHPHLTIARHRDRLGSENVANALARYRGPSWTASEVVLFASEPGPQYTPIERFGLVEHMR